MCVGGYDCSKHSSYNSSFIEKYDCRTDKWTPLNINYNGLGSFSNNSSTNLNQINSSTNLNKRQQFGMAIFENNLFIVGGRDGLKTLNSVSKTEGETQKNRERERRKTSDLKLTE